MSKKIQIPKEKADLVLHACIHFMQSNTENKLRESLLQFIEKKLPKIDPQLHNNSMGYRPGARTLYRALGISPPGHVRVSGNVYLPQILDYYIGEFEHKFPKEAALFRQEREKEKVGRQEAASRPAPTDKAKGKDLISFEDYIAIKSEDFVGRKWLFDRLHSMIHTGRAEIFYKSAYLLIHGDPGIGKTAFLAKMASEYRYIHHFNIQNEGINTAALFLTNICRQLIQRYHLDETLDLPDHSQNSIYLQQVLKAVSRQLSEKKSEPCIILVDAVDEVKVMPGETGNILFLPDTLPEHIFVILSSRKPGQVKLPDNSRLEDLPVVGTSDENQADAKEYLELVVKKEGIQSYLRHHNTDQKSFLSILLQHSEGNFIYLHHILREISIGIYTSTSLQELPQGLQRYYEEHWRVIKGDDHRKWVDYRLPVLAILAVSELPVDTKFISRYAGIDKTADIVEALNTWLPFLHKNNDKYSLYHKSFQDFLLGKDQVKGEALDLKVTRAALVAKMKKDLL